MHVYSWVLSGDRGKETRMGPGKGYEDLRAGGWEGERTHAACHEKEKRLLCVRVLCGV